MHQWQKTHHGSWRMHAHSCNAWQMHKWPAYDITTGAAEKKSFLREKWLLVLLAEEINVRVQDWLTQIHILKNVGGNWRWRPPIGQSAREGGEILITKNELISVLSCPESGVHLNNSTNCCRKEGLRVHAAEAWGGNTQPFLKILVKLFQ